MAVILLGRKLATGLKTLRRERKMATGLKTLRRERKMATGLKTLRSIKGVGGGGGGGGGEMTTGLKTLTSTRKGYPQKDGYRAEDTDKH